jgi:hypothetical protein
MRPRSARVKAALTAALFLLLAPAVACHSYHIDATIENHSGSAVRLLEVDYPSASFGVDLLAAGADFHYRFDVLGDGPITVQYTGSDDKLVKKSGPTLYERQEGRMEIVLQAGGQVEFQSELTPHR